MANSAAKKLAVANAATLKYLHLAFAIVNALVLLAHFGLNRPKSLRTYMFFSLPAVFLHYQLERIGRPKYDAKGQLTHPGEDLGMAGLTEWFQDVIYLTWLCDILLVLSGSNIVWYLFLLIPGYASFKLYTTFFKGKGFGAAQAQGDAGQAPLSKRQEKLEKKGRRKYVAN